MKTLTSAQILVMNAMRHGSIIGESSDKFHSQYELFTKKSIQHNPQSWNDADNIIVQKLHKSTVFVLLTLGLIGEDVTVRDEMSPFSRDKWYVVREEAECNT